MINLGIAKILQFLNSFFRFSNNWFSEIFVSWLVSEFQEVSGPELLKTIYHFLTDLELILSIHFKKETNGCSFSLGMFEWAGKIAKIYRKLN